MSKLVLLDTGVLGLATSPKTLVHNEVIAWINRLLKAGHSTLVPEIADYELRRELVRIGSINSVAKLNRMANTMGYLPLDTATMRMAAELWAQSRSQGRPLAHQHALDGDVILCAQVRLLGSANPHHSIIVASTNVGHLRQFVASKQWHEIN